MPITLKIKQMHSGGNHSDTILQDLNGVVLGQAVYDPARAQFAFVPDNQDIQLNTNDQTTIVNLLNSMSR